MRFGSPRCSTARHVPWLALFTYYMHKIHKGKLITPRSVEFGRVSQALSLLAGAHEHDLVSNPA